MDVNTITQKLHTIIEPYVEDKALLANVSPDTDLLNDLKINSADLVDVILDTEEVFDIEIDDDAAEQMLTVKDAVRIIQERIAS
jgi:acyl carrier protein